MGRSDCFVSVLAPVRNQARIIAAYIEDVTKCLKNNYTNYELVLVDDGSQDDTVAKIDSQLAIYKCIRLIRLSRSFGDNIAITAGLESVIGDFVVVMRIDSDPVELIPTLVEKARAGAGVVFGIRADNPRESWLVRCGACIFNWYCRKILKLNLPMNVTDFAVLSRQAVTALTQIKDRCRYLPLLGMYVGYGTERVVYMPRYRADRTLSRDLKQATQTAIDVMTSSSRHPLQFVTRLGIVASMLNGLYTCYIIGIYLFKERVVEGWTTVSLQNAGMFFFVFLILSVMSEYIGHILAQSQGRPLYYVLEERNSRVLFAEEERPNLIKSIPEVDQSEGIHDAIG